MFKRNKTGPGIMIMKISYITIYVLHKILFSRKQGQELSSTIILRISFVCESLMIHGIEPCCENLD